jgi:hypothetical protein
MASGLVLHTGLVTNLGFSPGTPWRVASVCVNSLMTPSVGGLGLAPSAQYCKGFDTGKQSQGLGVGSEGAL